MTDPVDAAVERLFEQFSVLAQVGYGGGALAGEQGLFRMTTPFSGRVMEGITVLSNLPDLPYGASPTRFIQDAVFKWAFVLSAVLQKQGTEVATLHQNHRWEMRLMQAAEEARQLRLFREFLAEKVMELEGGDTVAILRELKEVAEEAPRPALRMKCVRATAESSKVRAAVMGMTGDAAAEFEGWIEPIIYT